MSVQKIPQTYAIITKCPIVIDPNEQILTFKTSSAISQTNPVNSGFSVCFPNDYGYLQGYTAQCCGRNSAYSVSSAIAQANINSSSNINAPNNLSVFN